MKTTPETVGEQQDRISHLVEEFLTTRTKLPLPEQASFLMEFEQWARLKLCVTTL
jgi:hypothetical protein